MTLGYDQQTRHSLLGLLIDAVDYEEATQRVITAARAREPFSVSALAVHGVMEGVRDAQLRYRLNRLDLVTADGQPVRWAVNLLHSTGMVDRCYGPTLMLHVCDAAAAAGLPVFLYGSEPVVLEALEANLVRRYPRLVVAGTAPSVFGRVPSSELDAIAERIKASKAALVFAGLGCPRQEVFAFEMAPRLDMPVLAVGAAFDYHAGLLREPPNWVQRAGLQWLWRLLAEPGRLWRRYLKTNPAFVARVAMQRAGWPVTDPRDDPEPVEELGYA